MATIQLKRAFTFSGSANDALTSIRAKIESDSLLSVGEPMVVRYTDGDIFRYLMVVCTATSPASLTVYPSFSDLNDFAEYIKSISPSGSVTADDLQYVFENLDLEISGSTQSDFNGAVIDLLVELKKRLSWQVI